MAEPHRYAAAFAGAAAVYDQGRAPFGRGPRWAARVTERLSALRGDHPAFRVGRDRPAPDGFAASGCFDAFEQVTVRFTVPVDRAGVLAGVASISFVAAMEGSERAALLAAVGDGLERDAVDRTLQPYRADVWRTRRR